MTRICARCNAEAEDPPAGRYEAEGRVWVCPFCAPTVRVRRTRQVGRWSVSLCDGLAGAWRVLIVAETVQKPGIQRIIVPERRRRIRDLFASLGEADLERSTA